MADSNNIDINFKTTADTKGATETQKQIERTREAIKDLEQQQNSSIEGNVRTIRNAQIGQTLNTMAQGLNGVISLLDKLKEASKDGDKDLSKTLDSASKSVTTLQGAISGAGFGASIGGPWGALIGAIGGGGLSLVGGEVKGLIQSFEHLQKATALNNRLPQIFEAVKKSFDMKAAAETWRQLKTEIDATLRLAENSSALRTLADQAKVALDNIRAEFAEQLGVDPQKAQQTARETQQQVDANEIARAIADAFNRLSAAQEKLSASQNQIDQRTKAGASAEELEKLKEEARQLAEAFRQAKEAFDLAKQQSAIQGGTDGFGGTNGINAAREGANQGQDGATQALNNLANAAENNPLVAEQVAGIKAILEDGKITAEELKKLPQILQQYQAAIRGTGDQTVNLLNSALDRMEEYKGKLATLEQRMQSLQ